MVQQKKNNQTILSDKILYWPIRTICFDMMAPVKRHVWTYLLSAQQAPPDSYFIY